jgi:3-dehydroquinate synthase
MIAALHVALARKTITPQQADRMTTTILRYGPLPPFKTTAKKLVALTYADKKNRSGKRAYVLPTSIGATQVIFDITDTELHAAAETTLALMRKITNKTT